MKLNVVRTTWGLKAAFDEDFEKLKKIKVGEQRQVELTMPRNIRFHRKYFGLLKIVLDNLPSPAIFETPSGQVIEIKTTDDLLWHCKMQTGHYEQKVTLGGKIIFEPKSISFAAMGEDEFEKFYSDTIDVLLKYFIQCDREELIEQVLLEFA